MIVLSRYIFKQSIWHYIRAISFIIFLMWIIFILQSMSFVASYGVGIESLLVLAIKVTLSYLNHIMIICSIFVIPIHYYRNQEIMSFKILGYHDFAVCRPIITLAGITTIISICASSYISPYFYDKARDMKSYIKSHQNNITLTAKKFIALGKFNIFFEDYDKNIFYNIIIYDTSDKEKGKIVFAESAILLQQKDYFSFHLTNGMQQIQDQDNNITMMKFAFYPLKINNFNINIKKSKHSSLYDNSFVLYKNYKTSNSLHRKVIKYEIIKRITTPLIGFNIPCIIITNLLRKNYNRKRNIKVSNYSMIIIYVAFEMLLSYQGSNMSYLNMLFTLLVSVMITMWHVVQCRLNRIAK